jgi:hypothetical protein
MHAVVPFLILAAASDTTLLVLLCIMGVLALMVFALFNGRNPAQLSLDRHRVLHQLDDDSVALDVLAQIDECLRRLDYRTAHEYMLSHTNWFFLHRQYLPVEFSNTWLMLRNRVNRMLTVHGWPHDWAKRDLDRLREESLRLIEKAVVSLGGIPPVELRTNAQEVLVEEENQAVR